MDAPVSAREGEVLALLGKHLTHAEIAAELVLSVRTVESHVASLRRKLGIATHRDLVRFAAARQLVPEVPETSFVGRARERAEVADAIRAARLVSVVGVGGAGKTRLTRTVADDMADEFADGVWQVDLVPVTDRAGLAAAVAAACGVDDLPGRDVEDAIVRGLARSSALLVLDNCEHVADGVAVLVDRLVAHCPRLRVLVTSRARLVLPFERVYPIGGLAADDAVELLVARARAAGWSGTADRARLESICSRLAGLALAIELAAVRMPSLGLDGVDAGLADQRGLLVGGVRADQRQQSMQATLSWSFRLLDDVERAVLCRVSVFASGFDIEAAAAIAGFGAVAADAVLATLGRLVDQSLVVAPSGRRWRVLEPVRQFGLTAMTAADADAHARHHDWVRARADSLLRASAAGGRGWYDGFDEIADEVRAAIAWSGGADLTGTFATLLFRSGRMREAQLRYEQAGRFAAAAAVAKCRVQGDEALRLELADRDAGDATAALEATVRTIELILRFEGMFAGPVPPVEELLDHAGAGRAVAATVIALNRADPDDPRSVQLALEAADAAHSDGAVLRESAALDVATGALIVAARCEEALVTARRRLALFARPVLDPPAVLELKDALRMSVLTAVGAGELRFALECADRHRALPSLREQRDLAVDESLLPEVLAGEFDRARADADLFVEDWTADGSPAASGRAVGAAAVALMYGLLDDEPTRTTWLEVVDTLRSGDTSGTGYTELFDALVAVHRGEFSRATALIGERLPSWYGGLFERWRSALLEVARRGGSTDVLADVRAALQ